MVRLVIQIAKGLIRDQHARRLVMFYGMLAALVLLFAGATFLDGWLRAHPVLFLLFWAACAWLTTLIVLMAIFDMLMVRAHMRTEQRRLEAEYLKAHPKDDPHPR